VNRLTPAGRLDGRAPVTWSTRWSPH